MRTSALVFIEYLKGLCSCVPKDVSFNKFALSNMLLSKKNLRHKRNAEHNVVRSVNNTGGIAVLEECLLLRAGFFVRLSYDDEQADILPERDIIKGVNSWHFF